MRELWRGTPARPPRILLGTVEVAGILARLQRGFTELGVPCTFLNLSPHRFYQGNGDGPVLARWIVALRRLGGGRGSRRVVGLAAGLLRRLLTLALFTWALLRHDVFILCASSEILGERDPWIIRRCGRRLVWMCFGSESRPAYLDGSLMATDRGLSIAGCIEHARRQKEFVARIDAASDLVLETPTTSLFHQRVCVAWPPVGVPSPDAADRDALLAEAASRRAGDGKVRILHAPSHPEAKGTPLIRAAIRRLQERGIPIEYVEITGRPHEEVLAALAECDFVVDQMYAEACMAGLATEAALFGKPCVLGGLANEEAMAANLAGSAPHPLHLCHPDNVEDAILKLATDKEYREDLGRRARQFAEEQRSAGEVARRILSLLDGTAPAEWLFDARKVHYWHPCGMPEERCREILRQVIEKGGREALQLGDRPEDEAGLVAFAYGGAVQPARSETVSVC